MVRKEDILLWFTQQPSHHRLDVLCTLAHLCLPIELRFINTCVDYLTRRVAPSPRDAENLATLEKTCCPQPGEALDLQNEYARRKLIWSLCFLQASNRAVADTIYRILRDTYSDLRQFSPDVASSNGGNGVRDSAITELHLIFTMAIHHPCFSFEEKYKLGEIYRYLQTSRFLSKSRTPSPPTVITPTPTPSPPEAAAVTLTAPASSQAQMVSTSSSSGNRSPTNGRSSRTSTTAGQNSTSSLNRRHHTIRGHNKSNHSNGSMSGENSNNLSPITLLLKEQPIGKDQQNYNSLPKVWRRFEKLTAAELAEHSDEEFLKSGLDNTFISHLRKLINQQLQISNSHHTNDTGRSAGSTRPGGTRSNSSNGINEEPFSNQQSIHQQPHQVGSNNKPSMGPHRSSLVKTCMGPPNVQPAFNNTQQRNQQQAMQAVVEAQQQQLHQAAQHHHHQMQLQMQQQAFHQQMQHHLAQQHQQQQQHQQEPPLSRAGSSSSASSSGSSSLETCSPPSSPTDSATVAHRNGDADRKTYAAAAPQSVAPPTAGARPQTRGPSASPAPLRGPSANATFLRPIRNSSNDLSGNGHRHPTSSNSTVAAAPAPSSSISPALSSSSSSSSSTSSTSTSSTSTHRAASQPRDMPFPPSLSYAVSAQHQAPVAVIASGTVSAQPNPVPVVAASAVVPAQQPTASFIVNSSTPPPHIEAQPVYSYHGYLPMNGDGSSGYPQPPFTFITSGPPPGSTRGVPPGPHHEMFIYSPNSFQGQLVTQPLTTHHGSSINGRMMEMPYLQPILVTTTPGPSSRSDGMGTDYSRPPPPGTSSQPDCRLGGVPSPLPGNLSCFNCGASGHLGTQCQQISVEDIIRPSPAC